MILLFKKKFKEKIEILKVVHDTAVWVKVKGDLFNFEKDVYCIFTYVPHENNVFYRLYDVDIFQEIEEDVAHYSTHRYVMVMGDMNSRIGTLLDFIENDDIHNSIRDILEEVLEYDNDSIMPMRRTEDDFTNSFGRQLINLCKSTGLRVCNGRMSGDHNGKITFFNHLGSSLIDYALVDRMMFEKVKDFMVLDFNEWSDNSPILLTLKVCLKTTMIH